MRGLLTLLLSMTLAAALAVPAELDSAKWDYVESIIQYDADTRYNILLVSTEAELLPKIAALRETIEKKFQGTIKSLDREDQEVIYAMLQQEGLFMDLASLGKDATPEQIEEVLSRPAYSTDLEAGDVYRLAQKHSRTLTNIKAYWEEANTSFQEIIADIPEEKQDAFKALLRQPEVLDILDEHEDFTRQLGEAYEEEPDWVVEKTDSLAIFYQNEHKKEIAEYQKELDENPEMKKEMEDAAEEYAREFGYDPEELKAAQEEAEEQPQQNVTVNVTYNAYPYWFGYPYWYPMPMWRPYPWYYHCGFRYGRGGVVVVFGMPSYHYSMWFYRGPYRRYPSCARYHHYHHHRHPYTRSGFNNAYRRNNVRIQNNNIYVNGKNSNISRSNKYDYKRPTTQTRPTQPSYNKPASRPSTQPSQPSNPQTRPSTQPSTQPQTRPSTQPSTQPQNKQYNRSTQPSNTQSRGNTQQYRANDYHRSNWNRSGGASRSTRPAGGGARRR